MSFLGQESGIELESRLDQDELHDDGHPRRDSFARRLLNMGTRRRKGGLDYDRLEHHPGRVGKARYASRQPWRRRGVLEHLKRLLIAVPLVVLLLFGILHILQAIVGRAQIFWNVHAVYQEYLPHWGKLGHVGEGLSSYPTDATRDVTPVPCHSHNDYWRRIPLFDAIHWGCTGVEADVWHFKDVDDLFVGHNMASLTKNRTFLNLYVNPLVDLLDKMNAGSEFAKTEGHGVFDVDPKQTLVLLIDFKTDGHELFPIVSDQLGALREKNYLSYWDGEKIVPRAVTCVGTGNTPFDSVVSNRTYRDIFFDAPLQKLWERPRTPIDVDDPVKGEDARLSYGDAMALPKTSSGQGSVGLDDLTSLNDFNTSTSYYASVSFRSTVGFAWRGHLSHRQMDIIRGQIRGAKRRGLKARYWDTPNWPVSLRNHIWHVLMKEGADVLNVDDLKAAATEDWKRRGPHEFW